MQPGIDLVDVAEVARSLEGFGDRYLRRILHPRELASVEGLEGEGLARGTAAHFAAKEAVFKALRLPQDQSVPWTQIEVATTSPRPTVTLHGRAERWAREQGIEQVDLSITHDDHRDLTLAVAVAH